MPLRTVHAVQMVGREGGSRMAVADTVAVTARGQRLDMSEEAFGWLRPSDSLIGDAAALRARLDEDGYLFVPGLLDREAVRAGRMELLGHVAAYGALDPGHPIEDGILRPDAD